MPQPPVYMPSISRPCPDDLPEALKRFSAHIHEVPVAPFSGVYFLVHQGEVIYIGKSVSVVQRISSHKGPERGNYKKEFDAAFFIPLHADVIHDYEGALVRVLRPRFNGDSSGRGKPRFKREKAPASPADLALVEQLMVNITNLT